MQNDASGAADPRTILSHWLSTTAKLDDASLLAFKHELRLAACSGQSRSIGKGNCAEVFYLSGTSSAFKRAYSQKNLQLWNNFLDQVAIYEDIQYAIRCSPNILLCVPEPIRYIGQDNEEYLQEHSAKWASLGIAEHVDLLEMELIRPLPAIIRSALIDCYCLSTHQAKARMDPKNRDCLVRIYLGRRQENSSKVGSFSLKDFEMDLVILDELGLNKELFAETMAVALAMMHWSSHIDAAGVEFVLGSAPAELQGSRSLMRSLPPQTPTLDGLMMDCNKKAASIWLLDFDECREIAMDAAGVAKAVDAFWGNKPFWPKPVTGDHQDAGLWRIFEERYLMQSQLAWNGVIREQGLPLQFIRSVKTEAERRRMIGTTGKESEQ